MAHILEGGGHLDELLKLFLVLTGEDAVGAVTLLFLGAVNVHLLVGIPDFLDSEFDAANFQDILLLNFVVL